MLWLEVGITVEFNGSHSRVQLAVNSRENFKERVKNRTRGRIWGKPAIFFLMTKSVHNEIHIHVKATWPRGELLIMSSAM